MNDKTTSEEAVLADGVFSSSAIPGLANTASSFFFITITNQRAICTKIGGKGALIARTVGGALLGAVGGAVGASLASGSIDERAREIANAPIPQKLSLFPDETSVHPLSDVSIAKSIWTGNKLVIGLSKYLFKDGKKLRAFEAALKS